MNLLHQFFERPQSVRARGIVFQIHLWCGLILGLYLTLMGITGSMLVFEEEIEAHNHPRPSSPTPHTVPVNMATVVNTVRAAYPQNSLMTVLPPVPEQPTFLAFVKTKQRSAILAVDPSNGKVLDSGPVADSFLGKVADLHANLLAGQPGKIINGCAAIALLLLCVSGLVIWWPGRRTWKQGFVVSFTANWRRLSFDIHRVTGISALLFLLVWAVTAMNFAWPKQTLSLVNRFSSTSGLIPPRVTISPEAGAAVTCDLNRILQKARESAPGLVVAAVYLPTDSDDPLVVSMAPKGRRNLSVVDRLYFNPFSGVLLAKWRYGANRTFGEWLIWSMRPLHYGFYWGLGVKVIWALFGLSMPVLFITGSLMYWNRALRKRWRSSQ